MLPEKVRRSNALTMEVLQSKGLEFEDGASGRGLFWVLSTPHSQHVVYPPCLMLLSVSWQCCLNRPGFLQHQPWLGQTSTLPRPTPSPAAPHLHLFTHAVLVCDFLSSLADNAKEFRVLLNYLKYLKEHPAAVEEARQVVAQAAEYGGVGSSFLQSVQWQQKLGASSKRHLQRRLLEDVTLTAADKVSLIAADFDPSQHSGLIEELKQLYVAVTRAKSNVSCWPCRGRQHCCGAC